MSWKYDISPFGPGTNGIVAFANTEVATYNNGVLNANPEEVFFHTFDPINDNFVGQFITSISTNSSNHEYDVAFSPDGSKLYYTLTDPLTILF